MLASSVCDLQLLLDRFTDPDENQHPQIRGHGSQPEKKVEYLLRVGEEILPQVEELKYLGVFTNKGKIEQEIDSRIAAASAVIWTLRWSVVKKKELTPKGKALDLPVNLSSYPHIWSRALGSD